MRVPKQQLKLKINLGRNLGGLLAWAAMLPQALMVELLKRLAPSKRHQLIQSAGSLNAVLAAAHSTLALAHSI